MHATSRSVSTCTPKRVNSYKTVCCCSRRCKCIFNVLKRWILQHIVDIIGNFCLGTNSSFWLTNIAVNVWNRVSIQFMPLHAPTVSTSISNGASMPRCILQVHHFCNNYISVRFNGHLWLISDAPTLYPTMFMPLQNFKVIASKIPIWKIIFSNYRNFSHFLSVHFGLCVYYTHKRARWILYCANGPFELARVCM